MHSEVNAHMILRRAVADLFTNQIGRRLKTETG